MSQLIATSRVVLRHRNFIDVLDLSFRVVRESAGPLARVALLVLPLPTVLTVAIGKLVAWWAAWLFAVAVSGFVALPFTALVGQFVFEERPSVRSAVQRAARAYGRIFLADLAIGIGIFASSLLVIAPAFWVMLVTLFVPEAIVLEGADVRTALKRSTQLTNRAAGDALLGRIAALAILTVSPMLADAVGAVVLAQVLGVHIDQALFQAGGSTLAVIGFWLGVPAAAILRFLVYINVRTRTEGWDIQTAFASLLARDRDDQRDADQGLAGPLSRGGGR